jgi:stage II sporulation protein D
VSSFRNRQVLSGLKACLAPEKALLAALVGFILVAWAGCSSGKLLQVKRQGQENGAERARQTPPSSVTIRVAAEKGARSLLVVGRTVRVVSSDRSVTFSGDANIEIEAKSARIGETVLPLPVTLVNQDGAPPLEMNGRRFEGELVVDRDLVVNVLPLESYLKGVLTSEIPVGWPKESLKAQAVVSRTFALRKILDRKGEPFDVDNSEMDQKYVFAESNPPIEDAIEETEGIILSTGGMPIEAFFHASSGGVTESCRNVFQKDLPYLRSARDPYTEKAGEPRWTCDLDAAVIVKRMSTHFAGKEDLTQKPTARRTDGQAAAQTGILSGSDELKDVRVRSRTESGRVGEFALLFRRGGEYVVKGNDFRLAIGPKIFKSLLLDSIERSRVNGRSVFRFSGRGYGHGVGMSQLGAKTMAEMGYGYREILGFYYKGVRVERWDER